jgi:hypothetical protein
MMNEKQEFYARCSEILGVAHEYHDPVRRRTRWNARFLGNGRFPGVGLIQCYGAGGIRVMLRGRDTVWCKTYEEVYDILEKMRE